MRQATGGRAFERFINFSDGVTAVAITLLALPIVNIGMPEQDQTVWGLIAAHWGELWAYAITFMVVGVMWRVHARVFQTIGAYDTPLFVMNLCWLALIVVLPWPSSIYGQHGTAVHQGGEGAGGAGLLYWGTLAAISALMAAIAWYARRTPTLHQGEVAEGDAQAVARVRGEVRGLVIAVFFVLLGIATLFAPLVSQYLPLLLIPIMVILNRLSPPRS